MSQNSTEPNPTPAMGTNINADFLEDKGTTLRQTAGPLRLLAEALGGPMQWAGKLARTGQTLGIMLDNREVRRRLERLRSRGFMTEIPNGWQILFGGLDMLRYFIEPGARDYYQTRGINFSFHQLLRFLDDPVSMIDPVGLLSNRDTIIGHILQVVHANPVYDFQLLEMFEDGLDELERQTRSLLDGTHPRARTIGAIVEDPSYHARLLGYIERYLADRDTPQLRRVAGSARRKKSFVLAEETYGTLPGFMRYASRLPESLPALLRHYASNAEINPRYCDPEIVSQLDLLYSVVNDVRN
ncbi:MAG: hypothetical protein KC609_09170 [Myxococcales bacterium]|nr:hypothetical protein [Myxococcales bacterium]